MFYLFSQHFWAFTAKFQPLMWNSAVMKPWTLQPLFTITPNNAKVSQRKSIQTGLKSAAFAVTVIGGWCHLPAVVFSELEDLECTSPIDSHAQGGEEWEGDAFEGCVAGTWQVSNILINHEMWNRHVQGKQIRPTDASAGSAALLCTRMERWASSRRIAVNDSFPT